MEIKKITKAFLAVSVAVVSLTLQAASIKVGGSATVTLNEDGEAKLSVSGLSKGGNYTFVSNTGVEDSVADIDVVATYRDPDFDYDSGEYDEASLGTFTEDVRSTMTGRFLITQEDWVYAGFVKGEDFDPEFDVIYSAKEFYLYVSGDPGTTVTITSSVGIQNEQVPPGCRESPVPFGSIVEGKDVTKTGSFCDEDDYWYSMTLTAGRKYSFKVTGEGVSGSITMFYQNTEDAADDFPLPDVTYVGEGEDMKFDNLVYTGVPQYSGTHYLQIDGDYGAKFTIVGSVAPVRAIDKHPLAGELLDGQVATAVAGARNDSNGAFYDEIIDTSLYSVNLRAGRLALFETAFENEGCVMELYDAKGICLAKNFVKGAVEKGQRLSFVPQTSGTYYVGVCQDGLEASTNDVTVTGQILYVDLGEVAAEADDKPATANTISVVLGNSSTEGSQQFKADGSALELNATNRVDWFVLGARQGVTYNFIARADDAHYVEARPLKLGVYTLDAKGQEKFVQDLGDAQEGVEFVASANVSYYIKASLENGEGCECPYELYAWVNGENYGFLKVEVKGSTTSLWNLKGETAKYGNGSEILLAPGSYTVQSSAAAGWTKPADQAVTVVAGNENRATLVLKYSDTSDPKDDTMSGAVSLAPTKAKPVEASRSLWTNDAADWYKVSVKPYNYYEFALEMSEGAAEITVYRNAKLVNGVVTGDIVMQGEKVSGIVTESGTYYLSVTRALGFESVDCAYTLTAKTCNVGQVKTDKTAYTVGEKAGYLTVKLSRTAKEGKVRVRYTTVEETAIANENYVAQTGVVTWEDGDGAAKEVKIKIIPDLIDAWDENKVFHILLDAVADDELDMTSEYPAQFVAKDLEVTITESSKVAPGTVQIAFGGEEMAAFANAAKPVLTVAGGDTAVLWLTRTQGSDKTIAVSATISAKQTAGQEYVSTETQEIWWEDGDTETKALYIPTMRPTDGYFADQTFTVKLAAIAADGKATVKNGSATVTVTDGDVSKTMTEYAGSFTKASGVVVKEAGKNTWYFDAAGMLRSVTPAPKGKAELTFTVPAPGHLVFQPQVISDDPNAVVVCQIDKETIEVGADTLVDRYLGGTAKTTVKLSITRSGDALPEGSESYVALLPQDGDVPFLWEPLVNPTLVAPKLGANEIYQANQVHLEWSKDANPNVVYLLHVDKTAKNLGTTAAAVTSLNGVNVLDGAPNNMYPYTRDSESCFLCDGTVFEQNAVYSWRVDAAMTDAEGNIRLVATNKTVWAFKTCVMEAPGVMVSGTDAYGSDVGSGEVVRLVQGVKTDLAVVAADKGATLSQVSGGTLPAGLKFDAKTGAITGVPSKVGDFYVAFGAKSGTMAGATQGLKITVDPVNLATGTFTGLLTADGIEDLVNGNLSLGSVTVTSTDAGKVSAKVSLGASSLSFAATGWDGVTNVVGTASNEFAAVYGTLTQVAKLGTATYTNELFVVVPMATTNEVESMDIPMSLEMKAALQANDKKTVLSGLVYSGEARRDNTKFAALLAREVAPFVGYYTATLPVVNAQAGAPEGNGYVTLTIDAKGKVKVAGVMGDGTSFSASSVAYYMSKNEYDDEQIMVPVYFGKSPMAFGGWIRLYLADAADVCLDGHEIKGGERVPVVSSGSELAWYNGLSTAAYTSGDETWSAFAQTVEAVGGYYSTIVNLQAYYKGYAVYLTDLGDSLPEEALALLGEDYQFSAYPGLIYKEDAQESSGLYVDLSVNNVLVDKTTTVYQYDEKGKKTSLVDWSASVNPCKFALSYKSATGIFSGSMDMYASLYDEAGVETKQVKVGSFKHQGVSLMSRDVDAALDVKDAAFSGFYLAPMKIADPVTKKTTTWNMSYKLLFAVEDVPSSTEGWEN